MAQRGYAALVVPRADEYLGEYIPDYNERLRWLSGFTGSAGAALLLPEAAAIFVDGRYTAQVRSQVDPALFSYHHLLQEPPVRWLVEALAAGSRVACDPRLHSHRWYRQACAELARADIALVADADNLIDHCWSGRPAAVPGRALLLPHTFTGASSADKRARIGAALDDEQCAAAMIFAPDSLSWLLNVRGTDIPQLPVLFGCALLRANGELDLFVEPARVPPGLSGHVGAGVHVHTPEQLEAVLAGYSGSRVLIDEDNSNAWIYLALERAGAVPVVGPDPVAIPKACKNPVELAGSAAAHRRDAVAVVRFLAWLDREVAAGRLHDEAQLAGRLLALRGEGEHFHACSFDTISAAGPNAAMCHYNHLNGTPAALSMNSLYLCDSGGQYLDGTTDITRTVAIGDPGDEARRLFTLVLKGHIALARARFPSGTTGMQLDAFARQFLWREGYDYDHGTGHGVGVFLSVHEGPQRIAKTSDVELRPGMIVSNEPGYYRDGAFGMRCENLVVVRECAGMETDLPLLGFETLTLVPFDTRLLDTTLMDAAELDWLDAYHRRVVESVGPLLGAEDSAWLAQAAAPVDR